MATTIIKERPILFSGPMVRAILDGRKTQTRRVLNLEDALHEDAVPSRILEWREQHGEWFGLHEYDTIANCKCPYGQPGDRLWVRESFTPCEGPGHHCKIADATYVCYRDGEQKHVSSGEITPWRLPNPPDWSKQKSNPFSPSIHMPRWASRINLEIVCIRVERLNDISHHDALQEGLIEWSDPPRVSTLHYGLSRADCWETSAPSAYKRLWSTIHAADGPNGWAANPWVWVVEFKRV